MRTLLLLIASLPVFAGGFYLNVNPSTSALLTAQLSGCHQAEKGELTATAETVVDGKRQRLTLKTSALDKPGHFTVERPAAMKGRWVIHLSAKHPAFAVPTSALIPVTDGKPDTARAKWENRRAFTPAEFDALL